MSRCICCIDDRVVYVNYLSPAGWWDNWCRHGFNEVKIPWSAQWLHEEGAGIWHAVCWTCTYLTGEPHTVYYAVSTLIIFRWCHVVLFNPIGWVTGYILFQQSFLCLPDPSIWYASNLCIGPSPWGGDRYSMTPVKISYQHSRALPMTHSFWDKRREKTDRWTVRISGARII